MKKIFLISGMVALSMAYTVPTTTTDTSTDTPTDIAYSGRCMLLSIADEKANQENFVTNPDVCFNAYDNGSNSSILTHTAKKDFNLVVVKKEWCKNIHNISDIKVDIINENGVVASGTQITPAEPTGEYKFNVDNAYKELLVQITYKRDKKLETCPVNPASYVGKTSGTYALWDKNTKKYECYTTNETEEVIDYSTDNFAVKPDKFDILLKQSTVKTGQREPLVIKALAKDGSITTNYYSSSMNLNVIIDPSNTLAQYSFDIINGKSTSSSFLQFINPNNDVTVTITDTAYTIIDQDDTKVADVIGVDCRRISGTSNSVDVIGSSKYWAGTGTNENENSPAKNNVNADIKQNTKRDLHFNKMGW
jgi:hypothetical protein